MPKALVIDDNRSTADSLCQLLSLLDLSTRPAYGSRAAIIAIREEVPDIIFVDINMPGLNGLEIISFIRREPRLTHVPIIVITSDDQPETAREAKSRGALEVIIKPAMLDSLEAVLKQAKMI